MMQFSQQTIADIRKAQNANLKAIAAVKPSGALGRAVAFAMSTTHAYAVAVTHRDTGTLAASHMMKWEEPGMKGRIFINPRAVNPKSGARPSVYGLYEEARGGDHAFYYRAVYEPAPTVAAGIASIFVGALT